MPDLIVTDVRAALCKLAVETADLNIARNAEELAECDDEILAAICHSLFATIARPADAEVEGLVERVAKALHGRFYVVVTGTDDCHDWPYMPEELRESYRQGAREVIAILSSGPVAAETEHRLSGDETGWLIEMVEPEENKPPVPRWWHPEHGWMWDANKALRFAREIDAADHIKSCHLIGKPTEHRWM